MLFRQRERPVNVIPGDVIYKTQPITRCKTGLICVPALLAVMAVEAQAETVRINKPRSQTNGVLNVWAVIGEREGRWYPGLKRYITPFIPPYRRSTRIKGLALDMSVSRYLYQGSYRYDIFLSPTDGNTITVTSRGSINTSWQKRRLRSYYRHGIWAKDRNFIANRGKIITNGGITTNTADGINVSDWNTVINSGRINTKGIANGISVRDWSTVTNNGAIITRGLLGGGIGALDDNTITNRGKINTRGEGAHGIRAYDDNPRITNETGAILHTNGPAAAGIWARDKNKITNRGRITTAGDADSKGDGAHGIQARNHNTIYNERDAHIHTRGANAAGIRAGVSLREDGDLRKRIVNATNAALARAEVSLSLTGGHNTIRNDGNILTTGANAAGIQVTGKGNDVTNTGVIRTKGRGAAGLLAVNVTNTQSQAPVETVGAPVRRKLTLQIQTDDTRLTNSGGSIITTGYKALGIWVSDKINVTNGDDSPTLFSSSGDRIYTKGYSAHGIHARDKNTVINHGKITTDGDDAAGILARDNNTITNNGYIATEGDFAYGIQALIGNNIITNSADGRIYTSGANATGIQARLPWRLILSGCRPDSGHNIIDNKGVIETTGANAAGIEVWGEGNVVTNTGRIHTTGWGAAGLLAGKAGGRITPPKMDIKTPIITAVRRGVIKVLNRAQNILDIGSVVVGVVTDLAKERILGADNTLLLNTGEITTTGALAPGIRVSNKINVVHDIGGRIQVTGFGSDGIRAGNENLLILHGSITSVRGRALVLGHNNNVIHSGQDTLRSTGQDTPAVMIGDGNTLINTGRIEATGTGANAHGITGGSNNTLHNSGTISARGGKAVNLSGPGNTLNLLPGAALIGDMNLGPGGRVIVDTAPVNSVFWHGITARPKKRSEGAPFFYNARTRQLATYDTRALAASAGALGDASSNVSGLMARPGLGSSANRRSLIPTVSGSALWLRAFGNRARYRGQGNLNPEAGHLGLAAGYDLRLNATQFGVLAGYGRGELRFEGTQRFRPGPSLFKGPFAAFYVRRDFAPFSVQVGLAGGTLAHESSRLVNDNRAPNGLAKAEARTRSWWLAPEARIGLRLDAGLMQFEPAFTARYARQSIRGFSETGIRAPATVGQRKVELLETRLELKTVREVGPGRIALKAGWQYRDDLNSNQAQVRLLGESQRVRLESGLGSSLYLGAEAEFELAPGLFLNLSGEAVSGEGYRNMGMASVYQAF